MMDSPTTRRSLLRTGALGLAATAFVAACGRDEGSQPGIVGSPATATSTPATVPPTEPNSVALEADQTQLHTLASVEALVASVYQEHASDVSDATWRAAVERMGADHTKAAEDLSKATESGEADGPNEVLQKTLVDPVTNSLTNDRAVLNFLRDLESTLAATYITATGILSGAEDRQMAMGHGAACARRVGVLGNGGQGEAPQSGRFSLDDLIPGEAYLGAQEEEEVPAAEAEGN